MAQTGNHTPGPWRAEIVKGWGGDYCIMADTPKPIFKAVKPAAYYTDYAPGSEPGSVILSDEIAAKQGRYVATKEIKAELDAVEAANAHLIAAAPTMLAELRRDLAYVLMMKQLLEALRQTETVQYECTEMREAAIRAAIAKAEGR